MELSFNGFHQEIASFSGEAAVGDLVALNSAGQVEKAADGQDFIGVCVSRRGALVGVQLCGAAEVSFRGTAPAPGFTALAAAGENAVKVVTPSGVAAAGRKLLVLRVDAAAGRVVVLF